MNLTGVDVPISGLRSSFASMLWKDVSDKIYYSRVFRNPDKNGNTIGEVFIGDKEYEEVHFDDRYNVNSFFDVDPEITDVNPILQTKRNVGIVFAVRVDKIYPDLTYRAVEELYRDVLLVINNTHSMEVITDTIVTGLDAYGDLYTGNLKAYDMHPWHVFRVNTEMIVQYDCGQVDNTTVNAFQYPFPIILTN